MVYFLRKVKKVKVFLHHSHRNSLYDCFQNKRAKLEALCSIPAEPTEKVDHRLHSLKALGSLVSQLLLQIFLQFQNGPQIFGIQSPEAVNDVVHLACQVLNELKVEAGY